MVIVRVVTQQSHTRARAIGHPQIECPIRVPIHTSNRAGIVQKIETAYRGNVGKPPTACVEKETIAFVSTPTEPATLQFVDCGETSAKTVLGG
jgi:hypothetical protein